GSIALVVLDEEGSEPSLFVDDVEQVGVRDVVRAVSIPADEKVAEPFLPWCVPPWAHTESCRRRCRGEYRIEREPIRVEPVQRDSLLGSALLLPDPRHELLRTSKL